MDKISRAQTSAQRENRTAEDVAFLVAVVMVGGESCAGFHVEQERRVSASLVDRQDLHSNTGHRMRHPVVVDREPEAKAGRRHAGDARHQLRFDNWARSGPERELGEGEGDAIIEYDDVVNVFGHCSINLSSK